MTMLRVVEVRESFSVENKATLSIYASVSNNRKTRVLPQLPDRRHFLQPSRPLFSSSYKVGKGVAGLELNYPRG